MFFSRNFHCFVGEVFQNVWIPHSWIWCFDIIYHVNGINYTSHVMGHNLAIIVMWNWFFIGLYLIDINVIHLFVLFEHWYSLEEIWGYATTQFATTCDYVSFTTTFATTYQLDQIWGGFATILMRLMCNYYLLHPPMWMFLKLYSSTSKPPWPIRMCHYVKMHPLQHTTKFAII